jgi:hypothetical protein
MRDPFDLNFRRAIYDLTSRGAVRKCFCRSRAISEYFRPGSQSLRLVLLRYCLMANDYYLLSCQHLQIRNL